ncbi:MAG TPA: tetratricopeptide repeat protein [Anaerolineaceae bacterium]|nr:tetratricopeptide repeat protein [Anaerolineaceae bacterium]
MYIKGSKFSMQKRRRRSNPFKVILLLVFIAAAIYFDRMVVPTIPQFFQPTPTPTRAPESLVTDARSLEQEGKYVLAVTAYKQAVAADPRNPENFMALARLNIHLGNYEEAVSQAENALLLNPNNDQAMALRGWAIGLSGDYVRAVGALQDTVNANPNNAAAHAYLAEILIYMLQAGQGDLTTMDSAIGESRMAESLAPGTIETHRARGIVLEYTSNFEEAAAEFEAAIALNPNIADLHLALGRIYFYLQEYNDAITEYGRANALNPRDSTPETLIARTYAINGDYQKAIQYAEAALLDDPTNPFLFGNLGLIYSSAAQYADAIDNLRIAIRGGTSSDGAPVEGIPMTYGRVAQYYYTYGLALAREGQCDEAVQISLAVQNGLRNDDVAVYNAEEMVKICGGTITDSTPTDAPGEATSAPEVTP